MSNYHRHLSPKKTPQSQPIPGREKEMRKNLAGAYAFAIDDWTRLERFLILGSENGTYYIGERALTIQNADVIRRCLAEDWRRTIDIIVGVATSWRAAKHDPVLFALAIAASPTFSPEPKARAYALAHLSAVARIGTHLFTFVKYVNEFRGWGVTLRRAISRWYTDKKPGDLAYQMAKYQQRDGWSHHDVMHLAHPTPETQDHQQLFSWAKTGQLEGAISANLGVLHGLEAAKRAESVDDIVGLIGDYRLTREMIPTKWFNEVETWAALLPSMPVRALLRNLGKMTQIGLLTPLSGPAKLVVDKLNEEAIRKSHLHPWDVLNALYWYRQGRGMLGKLRWTPVQTIADALDRAFYMAFDNVKPTGQRIMIAVDVSGSMSYPAATTTVAIRNGQKVAGMRAAEAAAAMALVTARTEPNYMMVCFDHAVREAQISSQSTLADVTDGIRKMIRGATDYSAPILYAEANNIPVDAFVIYGDEQSWTGRIHPTQAMERYRNKMGLAAKLVVVNFCATRTSQLDPKDTGMLNLVGLDANAPGLISDFISENRD